MAQIFSGVTVKIASSRTRTVERLRTTVLTRYSSHPVPYGSVGEATEYATPSHVVHSHVPADPSLGSSPTPNPKPDPTDEFTGRWLECIMSEISLQLETLYGCETRLIFVNNPSPDLTFVFPDSESFLQVNTGKFALQTKKIVNYRILDAEARFCHLLQTMQNLPLEQRFFGDVDVKEELFEALNTIHRIKARQWTSQAYPDGHGGSIVDNGLYFSQKRITDATPTLLAALIMYIKNRSSTRGMRVNLALLRCILRSFAK
ncbi:hypothetical protein F5880DRAFT_1512602, partial [Lentinula raphanica]